jgi:hypothetical protein
VYRPMVLGVSQIRFADSKRKVDQTRDLNFIAPLTNDPVPLNWDQAILAEIDITELTKAPLEGAKFTDLPPAASAQRSYAAWQKEFGNWLARSQKVDLFYSPSLGHFSKAEESEGDFRIRMKLVAREVQDQDLERLRKKYAPKYNALDERIRKAQAALESDKEDARHQKYQAAASVGSSIFGTVIGSKAKSRQRKAKSDLNKSDKLKDDVKDSKADLDELLLQRKRLEEEFQTEVKAMASKADPTFERLETVSIRPTKTNISIKLVSLVWSPGT